MGYNVVAFPLAAGVLYPFTLSPEIAALAMSGSSALVAANALLLKRTKLEDERDARVRSAAAMPPRRDRPRLADGEPIFVHGPGL